MKRAIIAAFVASAVNAEDGDDKCSITFVEYDDDACATKTEKTAGEEYKVSFTAAETGSAAKVVDLTPLKTVAAGCVEPSDEALFFTKEGPISNSDMNTVKK